MLCLLNDADLTKKVENPRKKFQTTREWTPKETRVIWSNDFSQCRCHEPQWHNRRLIIVLKRRTLFVFISLINQSVYQKLCTVVGMVRILFVKRTPVNNNTPSYFQTRSIVVFSTVKFDPAEQKWIQNWLWG